MHLKEILKRPYHRLIIPDEESGTFTGLIEEFPGCIAQGDTPAQTYRNLERAAESWLDGAIENGFPVPEPRTEEDYSGRVVLRMPKSIHRRAVETAKNDGVSLNALLVNAVVERLGQADVLRELARFRDEILSAVNVSTMVTTFVTRGMPTPSEGDTWYQGGPAGQAALTTPDTARYVNLKTVEEPMSSVVRKEV